MKQIRVERLLLVAIVLFGLIVPMKANESHRIVCIQDGNATLAVDIKTGIFIFQSATDLNASNQGGPVSSPGASFAVVDRGTISRSGNTIMLTYPIELVIPEQTVQASFGAPESGNHEGMFTVTTQGQTFVGHTDNYDKSLCPVIPARLSEKQLGSIPD
jgi:hypothetical protein